MLIEIHIHENRTYFIVIYGIAYNSIQTYHISDLCSSKLYCFSISCVEKGPNGYPAETSSVIKAEVVIVKDQRSNFL